jgi:hypothetical protein
MTSFCDECFVYLFCSVQFYFISHIRIMSSGPPLTLEPIRVVIICEGEKWTERRYTQYRFLVKFLRSSKSATIIMYNRLCPPSLDVCECGGNNHNVHYRQCKTIRCAAVDSEEDFDSNIKYLLVKLCQTRFAERLTSS